ncbi:MAG: hypothetical protein ACT4O1_04780 [Gemmatimonadota bacterium]
MRRATVPVAALAFVVTSCATLTSVWRADHEQRFDAGVRAMTNGDYALAHQEMSWTAQHFGHKTEGQRAVLLLATMEMDPRNPGRRPEVGSDLAASYLRLPEQEDWASPMAQTLYLIGLELGAERAEAERQRELPRLPGPTVTARIRSVEQERDRLAKRVSALEEQLAEKDRELQRIRKTVRQ